MDDEEDEIDILGDFDLENLLTRRDRTQASFSFSSNDNYSFPTSDWILDNSSPLFNVKSVLTSDQVIYDAPPLFASNENLEINSNVWSDKERTLLDRGLDLFGKSYVRLSQYIGTKNPSQVKTYMRNYYPSESLASASSTNSLNCLDVGIADLDTVEVVISSEDAPPSPVPTPPPSYELTSLSEDSFDSDSYMGSTTSTASESERILVEQPRPPKPKVKKLVKKKFPPVQQLPQDDSDDDSVDYDNTNIIFKPRKLSKYHLMVKSGDRVLPSGEQVIRIKKDDCKSDSDVDVLESDDNEPVSIRKATINPNYVDVNAFNPECGMKVQGIVQCRSVELQAAKPEQQQPEDDSNVDIEVDVENDVENTDTTDAVSETLVANSCTCVEESHTMTNGRCKKRTSTSKNSKTRKKMKISVFRTTQCSNRESGVKNSKLVRTESGKNKNVYLNKPKLAHNKHIGSSNEGNECNSNKYDLKKNVFLNKPNLLHSQNVSSNENNVCSSNDDLKLKSKKNTKPNFSHSKNFASSNEDNNEYNSHKDDIASPNVNDKCNANNDDLKSKSKKKIMFKETRFRTERNKAMHVDDLLENYDMSNVRLLDHATQMQRIARLRPVATQAKEARTANDYISVEEIDYHRDFFLHNDPFFVMRFLKIRNYILREWNCKKPKYINKTSIRSGLKHCGSASLITRVHSYLEQRGLINT